MRKKVTKPRLPYGRFIFMGFVIFCVAVLAWDVSQNGFSAAWGALPAGDIEDIFEPEDENAINPASKAEDDATDVTTANPAAGENSAAEFATLRLEREQARAEELALLDKIIADENSSPAILEDAENRRLEIASDVENEIMAESILAAKGYGETVVMLGASQATVIIDLEIDEKDAAVIAEIVDKASGCGFENVVIVNR
jgi:hypothetical protein